MRQCLITDGTRCPYCGDSGKGYKITRMMRQEVKIGFDGSETIKSQAQANYSGRSGRCEACQRVFRIPRKWEVA